MRSPIALAAALLVAAPALAQKMPEPPPRFGVPAETEFYPQDAPKQTLAALAKAFDRKRVDYVLAHLLEPSYGDAKIADYYRQRFGKSPDQDRELTREQRDEREKAALQRFVAEVNEHMASEPRQTARFYRLLREGNVEEAGTTAKVTLKDTPNVALTLRQVEGRWYLVNDVEGAKPAGQDKPRD